MKILIMGFTKLKYMPYLQFYLNSIDKKNNDIDILYWNRDLNEENVKEYKRYHLHEFKCFQEDDVSKLSKITSFIKYRKFAIKTMENNKYDKLI